MDLELADQLVDQLPHWQAKYWSRAAAPAIPVREARSAPGGQGARMLRESPRRPGRRYPVTCPGYGSRHSGIESECPVGRSVLPAEL